MPYVYDENCHKYSSIHAKGCPSCKPKTSTSWRERQVWKYVPVWDMWSRKLAVGVSFVRKERVWFVGLVHLEVGSQLHIFCSHVTSLATLRDPWNSAAFGLEIVAIYIPSPMYFQPALAKDSFRRRCSPLRNPRSDEGRQWEYRTRKRCRTISTKLSNSDHWPRARSPRDASHCDFLVFALLTQHHQSYIEARVTSIPFVNESRKDREKEQKTWRKDHPTYRPSIWSGAYIGPLEKRKWNVEVLAVALPQPRSIFGSNLVSCGTMGLAAKLLYKRSYIYARSLEGKVRIIEFANKIQGWKVGMFAWNFVKILDRNQIRAPISEFKLIVTPAELHKMCLATSVKLWA